MVVGVGGLCDLWSTAGIFSLDSKRKNWKTSVWRGHRWNRFQSFNPEKTVQQKFSALCESLRINVLPMGLTQSDLRFNCGFVTQEIALYDSTLCKGWLGGMRTWISTRETEIYQNTYFIYKRASPFYHLYQLKLLSVIQPSVSVELVLVCSGLQSESRLRNWWSRRANRQARSTGRCCGLQTPGSRLDPTKYPNSGEKI